MTSIQELSTPSFLVNRSIVENNTRSMYHRAKKYNLTLRPHIKTHKTVEGALLQTNNYESLMNNDTNTSTPTTTTTTRRRVVVSTLAEAEFLISNSQSIAFDILYAVPVTCEKKLKRILQMMVTTNTGSTIHVEVDSIEGFQILRDFANANLKENSPKFSVFVNLNCGGNREGCNINDQESFDLVKMIVECNRTMYFAGLYTHGGQSYGLTDLDSKLKVAESEASAVNQFAMRLQSEHGITSPVVSVGSTPTCSLMFEWDYLSSKFPLVNEIHPGNYVFYDYMMYQMGNCNESDIAVTVLTTIIGKNKQRRTLLVDAGALALSKDLGVKDQTTGEFSYGAVKGYPGLMVKSLTQEMGVIQCTDDETMNRFNLGDKLEIYPNHSCLTAAMYSEYQVVNNEGQVVEQWKPCKGW